MPLRRLTETLFEEVPKKTLYHYTSLGGAMGIVKNNALWATEIRYFSDASELAYTANELSNLALRKNNSGLMRQFREWSLNRIKNGNLLFIGCFTENGNILSQWRGYCPPNKGVSLGFSADSIKKASNEQRFSIGRCIYKREVQDYIFSEILNSIEEASKTYDPSKYKKPPSQSFFGLFESFEDDLLKIASLVKNPAFKEENEWRVISPVVTNYAKSPIQYREGASTLIPYIIFHPSCGEKIEIEHAYVGPSPKLELSFQSFAMFLSLHGASPKNGISNSMLPYSNW